MPIVRTDEELQIERDLVFVEEFLQHEDKDDAAVIACRKAGILDPHFPVAVTAKRMLERPEIQMAIKAARAQTARRGPPEVSKESILADLDGIFQSTLLTRDHAAANANRKLVAQITGILREDVTITHRYDVKILSDGELEKIAMRGKIIDVEAKEIPPGIGHMKVIGGESDNV